MPQILDIRDAYLVVSYSNMGGIERNLGGFLLENILEPFP